MELAFGQGTTLVTPLQQAVAYATFANGGTRYAPQLVAAVVSPSGKVVKRMAPKVTGKITYTPAEYSALIQGFEGVVDDANGTGYPAFVGSGWNQQAFPAGREDGHGQREQRGAGLVVRGLRPAADTPVRGGLRHQRGGLRGRRRRAGGPQHLQLPGRPPGRRPGRPASVQHRALAQPGCPSDHHHDDVHDHDDHAGGGSDHDVDHPGSLSHGSRLLTRAEDGEGGRGP